MKTNKVLTIGIIANITKQSVAGVIDNLILNLKKHKFDFLLSNSLLELKEHIENANENIYVTIDELFTRSDIVISIGGDGTMLNTAYCAQFTETPILGVNFGKLGFLAEIDINKIHTLVDDIKNHQYTIEERLILTADCKQHTIEPLYAINDIVIDKAGWPKMIEITVSVDNEYVTSFSADGLIIATPTGTTGYSLSAGGPIVSPKAEVITLSPICPHSLTMRPLVLPNNQEITIRVDSLHKEVQVNCDGQRVFAFAPPLELTVKKGERPIKLIHTTSTTYFEILREKLLWGFDVRQRKTNGG